MGKPFNFRLDQTNEARQQIVKMEYDWGKIFMWSGYAIPFSCQSGSNNEYE